MWDYSTPGIPDELFERSEDVPITKEDVRALAISKLRLKEGFSAIDVGCGSGSITVEMCLQVKGTGNVYAIDLDSSAVELTKKNLQKFGVQAQVVQGKAQDVLPALPQVDAVLVGGTWGDARQVMQLAAGRLRKGGRIVVDTILIETTYQALAAINEMGDNLKEIDVTQVTIAKARRVTTGTMMLARNPVMIISATKA
ncbi:precorrin-6Y C5,15-methyltransferase (decarboxylating) subunit CbiT [Nitrososphaera sp.]|uniref:precorrin-6Y C5,15-methyltransferase (decarboxylating) subunit CbiT n=1 Tax=Nitrososphaera sp. TaxID=1971748 RepID=UPI00307E7CEF